MAEAVARDTSNSQIIVSNSIVLLSRRLLLWGFSAVIVLFLPRYLGDVGLGQLAFAQSVAALFTTVLSLGLGEFLTKEIARNRGLISTHLGAAIGLRLVMSVIVMGIVLAIAAFMSHSAGAERVLLIAAATAIAYSFARLLASVLSGLEEMSFPAMSDIAGRVLILVVGIPVLVQGGGVVPYALVLLLAALVNVGLNAGYVARRFPLRVSFDPSRIRFLLLGGAPFILMGFLLDIYNQTDTIVLRMFSSDAVVGWYAAANNIYKTIDLLPLALTAALLPTLSRIHHEGAGEAISVARKSITVGALAIVPLSVGISLFSREVIATLPYPDAFQNTVPLLTILALTIPVTSFLVILGTIAVAVDRQKAWVTALAFTVGLNVALNVAAAPYFQGRYGNGGIGVALTTFVCELAMVVFGVWLMPRGIIGRDVASAFIKVGLSAAVMAGMVLLAKSAGLGTVPAVAVGAVTYGSLALVTKAVTVDDLRTLLDILRRRLPPAARSGQDRQEGD